MPISGRYVVTSSIVLLAIGLLTLLGIVGATVWLGQHARIYAQQAAVARDIQIAAVELRSALQSAETSQRGYLVGGNEIYLAPYDTAKASAQREQDKLMRLFAAQPDSAALLARLSAVIADKFVEMDQTKTLKRNFQDAEATALFRTNRGKALMDEANVYLSSIVRNIGDRLAEGVAQQNANADRLRLVSIIGAITIVLVVGGVAATVARYAAEIAQARDDVRNANVSLELRVRERTADLGRARDRAEALLSEVNHRVANSLTLIASLVRLQGRAVAEPSARAALAETEGRIHAISMVHQRLYTTGDAGVVALDEYLAGLLDHLRTSTDGNDHGSRLRFDLTPMTLATDAAINLGVIVTEWVTNAVKYAYPGSGGEIRVKLRQRGDGRGELVVEDDGVGRSPDGTLRIKGTGLGSRVVAAMADSFGATIAYDARSPGTAARLTFPLISAIAA